MPKFRSIPKTIEAEQFLPPYQIPKGVFNVYSIPGGEYTGQVRTIQGQVVDVKSREWIVTESNGVNHYPIAPEEFEKNYIQIDKDYSHIFEADFYNEESRL